MPLERQGRLVDLLAWLETMNPRRRRARRRQPRRQLGVLYDEVDGVVREIYIAVACGPELFEEARAGAGRQAQS
jgi:hypothetical protein